MRDLGQNWGVSQQTFNRVVKIAGQWIAIYDYKFWGLRPIEPVYTQGSHYEEMSYKALRYLENAGFNYRIDKVYKKDNKITYLVEIKYLVLIDKAIL